MTSADQAEGLALNCEDAGRPNAARMLREYALLLREDRCAPLVEALERIWKRCQMANEADWDAVAVDCMKAAEEALRLAYPHHKGGERGE